MHYKNIFHDKYSNINFMSSCASILVYYIYMDGQIFLDLINTDYKTTYIWNGR